MNEVIENSSLIIRELESKKEKLLREAVYRKLSREADFDELLILCHCYSFPGKVEYFCENVKVLSVYETQVENADDYKRMNFSFKYEMHV